MVPERLGFFDWHYLSRDGLFLALEHFVVGLYVCFPSWYKSKEPFRVLGETFSPKSAANVQFFTILTTSYVLTA